MILEVLQDKGRKRNGLSRPRDRPDDERKYNELHCWDRLQMNISRMARFGAFAALNISRVMWKRGLMQSNSLQPSCQFKKKGALQSQYSASFTHFDLITAQKSHIEKVRSEEHTSELQSRFDL